MGPYMSPGAEVTADGRAAAVCSGQCSQCGRALRACEWCGGTGVITEGGHEFPVITRPDWDGAYHEPCRDAEQQVLHAGAPAGHQHLPSP